MISFKQYLMEARFQERLHRNPSIDTLKNLAKHNSEGEARFVIHRDTGFSAGDANGYVHEHLFNDADRDHGGRNTIIGFVWHHHPDADHGRKDNSYTFSAFHHHNGQAVHPDQHPILQRLEKNGLIHDPQ
jgi:hypothetical protein